jgi:putative transcriptional regulator
MAKRDIFGELMEGVAAMKSHREGKLTLRSYKVEVAPLPKVDSKLIRDTRKRLRCSRAVFARKLRINERTLEKWEQGRAKPNPQAAALQLWFSSCGNTLIPSRGSRKWPRVRSELRWTSIAGTQSIAIIAMPDELLWFRIFRSQLARLSIPATAKRASSSWSRRCLTSGLLNQSLVCLTALPTNLKITSGNSRSPVGL